MPSAPRRVFVTHGEPEAADAMARHIRERFGWAIEVPQYGEKVRTGMKCAERSGVARCNNPYRYSLPRIGYTPQRQRRGM